MRASSLRFVAVVVLLVFLPVALGGCGETTAPRSVSGAPKLVRIPQQGKIGGVCAGVAYYLGVNVTLVRVAWVVLTFFFGAGLVVYIVSWALLPVADSVPPDYAERTGG
jgi:phage shock protein PspC (stress-responsive transcriptional regulator)